MADPVRDSSDGTPTPRWVKVFAIIGGVLVLLVVVMLLAGHGPGNHLSGATGAVETSSPEGGQ